MPDFSPDDVWAVARALVDYCLETREDCLPWCNYCGRELVGKELEHHLQCPVLKAKDLLTGAPEPHSVPLAWEPSVERDFR